MILIVRTALWVATLFVLAVSAGTDVRHQIVPNKAVIFVAAAGLGLSLVSRPESTWVSLLVSVVVLCGLGILAHSDFLGGGDAKLIAAVTLLVPPDRIEVLLLAIALAGGVLSAIYLVTYRALKPARLPQGKAPQLQGHRADQLRQGERALFVADNSLPYGLAVFGGVSVYVASEFYQCLFATSCSL